ncbi:MAG: hypothetical protein AAGA83_27410 [Cyanobacteria bacterium P01_F01_bin.116]
MNLPNSQKSPDDDIDQVLVHINHITTDTCKVYTGNKALLKVLFSWLFGK